MKNLFKFLKSKQIEKKNKTILKISKIILTIIKGMANINTMDTKNLSKNEEIKNAPTYKKKSKK
jgi:hypothetical protein